MLTISAICESFKPMLSRIVCDGSATGRTAGSYELNKSSNKRLASSFALTRQTLIQNILDDLSE